MLRPQPWCTAFAAVSLLGGVTSSAVHSAEAGAPSAEEPAFWYARGQQYLRGEGVSRDGEKAVELLKRAASAGHGDAWAALGYCYSSGTGAARDDAEARRCFEQGAAKGSAAAKGNLGSFLVHGRGGARDADRGVALMEEAIAAGSAETALLLGETYYFGQHADGVPDFERAYRVLLEPARKGDAGAQNMVGVILKDGRLGEKQLDDARVWLEKAALQGNGKACHNLADLWNYRSPDRWARIEALRWLIIGEAVGEALARIHLTDIRPAIAADELSVAEDLAEITLRGIARDRRGKRSDLDPQAVGGSPSPSKRHLCTPEARSMYP